MLNLCLFYIMTVYCFFLNFYILKTNSEWTCIAFTTALHEHSQCLKQHASFTHSHKYFFCPSPSYLTFIHIYSSMIAQVVTQFSILPKEQP